MKRGDLFNLGEQLADLWCTNNEEVRSAGVLGRILSYPAPIAAALAAIVANELDQVSFRAGGSGDRRHPII